MTLTLLKRDLLRKKSVSAMLFALIFASALLASGGTGMILYVFESTNSLMKKAAVPHYVQMHSGALDVRAIDRWAARNRLVREHQIVEMVPVEGSRLYFGGRDAPETASVMDFYFVRQNERFDFLLNLDNERVDVAPGEIAVPIYFMRQRQLAAGDRLRIVHPEYAREFVIRDFVRDAQMNPSIVHSKRFVIHPDDYDFLKRHAGAVEYLIEFRLHDAGHLGAFHAQYESSGLPGTGPAVDMNLFRLLNALTDGIVAAALLMVSLVLMLIAMLCVRLTLLSTMEEDVREIGVLKALGASRRFIRRIYLAKYIVLAGTASLCGCAASYPFIRLMAADLTLSLGTPDRSILQAALPLCAAALLCVLVILFCLLVLRRYDRVSAAEALRSGMIGETEVSRNRWRLHRSRALPVPVFLGLQGAVQRHRTFRLLFFVFAASAFLMLVPLHFLNTIQSPGFISYLGIGRSDLRIDLQYSDRMDERFRRMVEAIRRDDDVARFAPLVTSRYQLVNDDGTIGQLHVETGDFTIFPLDYVQGSAPVRDDEIALSVLNARELGVRVGDAIRLIVNGETRTLIVSGIYQDITNGGRTAKARLPHGPGEALRYAVSLDLMPHVDRKAKLAEFEQAFKPAKVTELQGYVHQTLGGTIRQIRHGAMAAFFLALCLAMLITALYLRLLMAKDRTQIAILRSLGFAMRHIRTQYAAMTLAVLLAGIAAGTLLSNTLGQQLAGAVWSFLGASRVAFVIRPLQAYAACPLVLMLAVAAAAWLGAGPARDAGIAEIIKE